METTGKMDTDELRGSFSLRPRDCHFLNNQRAFILVKINNLPDLDLKKNCAKKITILKFAPMIKI